MNAPFSRPNNSLSISVDGIAAQLTRTIGRLRLRAELVDPRREDFLAGARLAEEQDRRIGGGDLLDQLHHPPRRRTLADRKARHLRLAHLAQDRVLRLQLLFEASDFGQRAAQRLFALPALQHLIEDAAEDADALDVFILPAPLAA